jgi:MFS family permease
MIGRARLRHIIITEFLFLIGFAMMVPLLPLFVRNLQAGATTVGFLLAANQAVDLLFAPVAGRLSDRFGRRILLLPAMVLTAFSYLAIGFANSLLAMFVVWIIAGFGSSHVLLSQAYVADVTSTRRRTSGMGYWGASFAMAFVIGPPLGAFLYSISPFMSASVAAGIALLATIYAVLFLGEPKPTQQKPESVSMLRHVKDLRHSVLTIITLNFLVIFIWSQFTTVLPLYTQDVFNWKVSRFGIYLGAIGLIAAIVQGVLVGPLVKRLGHRVLVASGFGLLGLGLAFLAAPLSTPTLIISVFGIAVGFGLLMPSLPALLSMNVHPERKGLALGIFQSASTVARILAPILAGLAYEQAFPSAPFVLAATLGLLVMVMTSVINLRNR